jgi:copper oxidase (laccase) domain-containing protein
MKGLVYTKDLFGGAVTIWVFGAHRHWGYKGGSSEEIEANNPGITWDLMNLFASLGINHVVSPIPAFNAEVVAEDDLQENLIPGMFRGLRADGVLIHRPGTTFAIASADCPTTVLYDPVKKVLAALHCGRDALLDRTLINTGIKGRNFGSVITAVTHKMMIDHQTFPPSLQAFVAAGIGADSFEHPTVDHPYAEQNAMLIDHLENRYRSFEPIVTDRVNGRISLNRLIERQLCGRFISPSKIEFDGVDTATDVDKDGVHLFHSNRRDKTKRNLVLVRLN